MKIVVALMSGSNNTERMVLRSFYQGVVKYYLDKFQVKSQQDLRNKHNLDIVLSYELDFPDCDIGVQFGSTKDRKGEHHVAKQNLQKKSSMLIIIETPILGRVINKKSEYAYYRVGINGFLNNQGLFYSDELLDYTRVEELLSKKVIKPFPGWKNHATGNILILTQLLGDASLRGQKMSEWVLDTIDNIREHTDRKIVVRLHPAMSQQSRDEFYSELGSILFKNYLNIHWASGLDTTLSQDLKNAGICVTLSSGSAVDSILAGVPVIAQDEGNFAYPISSTDLEDIDCPKLASPDEINHWLAQLANSQWSKKEMSSGLTWSHIVSTLEHDNIKVKQ